LRSLWPLFFFSSEVEFIRNRAKATIVNYFVPELPLDIFSAETWDINDETQILMLHYG
jgi:hypothetical protein